MDLSEARLDGARLGGNIADCRVVDAVLDRIDATNAIVRGDFSRASLVSARLTGCHFEGSILREADFTRARMPQASLRGCDCTQARFIEADMRFSGLQEGRLEGADLSGVDLAQACLTGVIFDDRTSVDGADLSGVLIDDDFARFAGGGGGRSGPPDNSYVIADLDAIVSLLRERDADGHLIPVVEPIEQLRDQLVKDPEFDWTGTIAEEFPDDIVEAVAEAVSDADPASEL